MTANQVREKYLKFFEKQRHAPIAPAPLVPKDDPTTLFTSSGMQQLVPFLKGQPHPMGVRLTNSQPCFRAQDIEEVGDNRHTTFFEMLGNWSLGDYFKKEQLPWIFEFLTQELGLNPEKLYVTVFEGNESVPRDEESIAIWQELFKTTEPTKIGTEGFDPNVKIYTYGASKNWWSRSGEPENMPAGEIGGPDSEIFYDFGEELRLHENSPFKDIPCHPNCDCGRFLEIGNSVFMEYIKTEDGNFKSLPQKNVDFGGGLERLVAAVNNNPDVFQTDLFKPLIEQIEKITKKGYSENKEAMRVVADHLRAATFMIAEGVEPSNKLQGYVLRRLLRRAAVKMRNLSGSLTPVSDFEDICEEIIKAYEDVYFDRGETRKKVEDVIGREMSRFAKSLDKGLKEISSVSTEKLDAAFAFNLFQTYGFPFEVTQELAVQKGKELSKTAFDEEFRKHQELSRTAAKGMFKGGLADHSKTITKLHTATHLLHQALRQVLGEHIQQVGSNITAERLRFDFNHNEKLNDEQVKKIEKIVNEQIQQNLPVTMETMTLKEAQNAGALAFFGERYGEKVNVYSIGSFSKEVCGGPHVTSTGELGTFTITKQESVGQGKRRVYATLQ
ncbi:MAG: alanine--tRNA ligase [Patescibacteria group bacterium]